VNPDGNFHAPNESLLLDNHEKGIRAICLLWEELGRSAAAA
jgi:acetylornithine deacetylase/succinyl-diaminopimelate desuccinylase-like protein